MLVKKLLPVFLTQILFSWTQKRNANEYLARLTLNLILKDSLTSQTGLLFLGTDNAMYFTSTIVCL